MNHWRAERLATALKPLGRGVLAVFAVGCSESPGPPELPSLLGRTEDAAWGSEQRLEAADAAEIDQFGYSVSLARDRALVGAYGESLYRGAAYVFVRSGDSWIEEQKLIPADGVEGASFGWSVSLGAQRLLVGASADASHRGAAYVFVRSGDSWVEEQKLVAGDAAENDSFGWSVSLSDERALVGAFAHASSRGAVYVFKRSDGVWLEEQKLVSTDGVGSDLFGYSVFLTPDEALIGAPGQAGSRGAAHLFTLDGGSWARAATLTAGDSTENDHFGISVSVGSGRALVGAYSNESLRGAAYVFSEAGSSWSEDQKLVAADGMPGDRFGNAVALGGEDALVAAYANDDARGATYHFTHADGSFHEQQKLVASDGLTSDFFGWSVALDGQHALVGAHYDDVLRGAAYVYSSKHGNASPAPDEPTGGCHVAKHSPPPQGSWPLAAVSVFALARCRRGRRYLPGASLPIVLMGTLGVGCGGVEDDDAPAKASPPGVAGSGVGGSTSECVGTHVVTSKRVVRLTEYQLHNAYSALFGADAAAAFAADGDRPSLSDRELPPISGDVGVSEGLFARQERLAHAAMRYVSENAGTLTGCAPTPTDASCALEFLHSFAERAFRHPLDEEERRALLGRFWNDLVAAGLSVEEALANGVYGVLISPGFVYRTELGSGAAIDGPLTPYELASAVSWFLTDGPPDDELLEAARSDQLRTPDLVRAQASRLLETEGTRRNLEQAVLRYFSLARAGTVILNPQATPGLTVSSGLQASIVREGELFVRNLLWSEPLTGLLTSRQTWTTPGVATSVYGAPAPAEVDADGFGLVDLPANRSGLLTLSTFLLAGARSTGSSPVARGLTVNASIVCAINAPFPEVVNPETGRGERDPEVTAAIAMLSGLSELEKAQYRATTPRCAGCHLDFDAFGMVLEPYDAVGRFRTTDLQGRPIDESWTTTALPESVGGATVTNVLEAADAIASSRVLDRCMAMTFIDYALTEVSKGGATNTNLSLAPTTGSCAVKQVVDRFESTDRTFRAMMTEIAASDALALRSGAR